MPYVPAGAAVQNSGFDGANETILIWYDSVQCRGNEARLIDCIVSEPRLHNCDHSQDVGVRCGKTSCNVVYVYNCLTLIASRKFTVAF